MVVNQVDNTGEGANIRISVNLSHDAPVGYYKILIILKRKEDNTRKYVKYVHNEDIIVLFNPGVKVG